MHIVLFWSTLCFPLYLRISGTPTAVQHTPFPNSEVCIASQCQQPSQALSALMVVPPYLEVMSCREGSYGSQTTASGARMQACKTFLVIKNRMQDGLKMVPLYIQGNSQAETHLLCLKFLFYWYYQTAAHPQQLHLPQVGSVKNYKRLFETLYWNEFIHSFLLQIVFHTW